MDIFEKVERAVKIGIAIVSAYQALLTLRRKIKDAKRGQAITANENNPNITNEIDNRLHDSSQAPTNLPT